MSGPFYGSLAASASVFVAILTALLVNNYVRIKADRRQLTLRISQIEGDLDGLREERDEYQETVYSIRASWEAEHREEAEERVDKFIDDHIRSSLTSPIEKLTVDGLYQELLEYVGCETANELEDSQHHLHHKDVLEDRFDKIQAIVLRRTVEQFASKYEGRGWESPEDPVEQHKDDDYEPSEEVRELIESIDRSPMELEEFIEKYKEEFGLDHLDNETVDELGRAYDEIVDKERDPSEIAARVLSPAVSDSIGSLAKGLETNPALDSLVRANIEPVSIGLSEQQRRYENARDNLIQAKSEFESLQREKETLNRQRNRLNPGDLSGTLYANAATILLSVVTPMAAYLATDIGVFLPLPNSLSFLSHTEFNVFLSWLVGLIIVLGAIYLRINETVT